MPKPHLLLLNLERLLQLLYPHLDLLSRKKTQKKLNFEKRKKLGRRLERKDELGWLLWKLKKRKRGKRKKR